MLKVKYWILILLIVGFPLLSFGASLIDNMLAGMSLGVGGAFIGMGGTFIVLTKYNLITFNDKFHWWDFKYQKEKDNGGK